MTVQKYSDLNIQRNRLTNREPKMATNSLSKITYFSKKMLSLFLYSRSQH